jgi:uncharacterized protein
MKKLVLAVLTALLLAAPVSAEAQLPRPSEQFYINDFAEVLSDQTEQQIFNKSRQLDAETGAQIVVVTVPNLDGSDIETYANRLFREWRLGDSQKNSGLLLLVAVDDRRLRIEVGYGLEGILPDGKAGRIRDEQITPSLRENRWDDGVLNGYNALYEVVDQNRAEIGAGPTETTPVEIILMALLTCLPPSVVLAIIFMSIKHPDQFRSFYRRGNGGFWSGGGGSSGGWGGGGGFSGGGGSSGGGGASGGF